MTKARKRGSKPKEGPREPSGRLQRPPKANSVRMAVIESRARRLGVWPAELIRGPGETDEQFFARQVARRAQIAAAAAYVTQPWMGCNAGRAIAAAPDVVALWQVATLIRLRRMNYLKAICAPPDEAMGMRLPVKVEIEGESGDAIVSLMDDSRTLRAVERTEEEDADAAISAWDSLTAIFNRLGPGCEEAIIATVILDEERPRFRLVWALGMIRKALAGEEWPKAYGA